MRLRCLLLSAAFLAVLGPAARPDENPALANGNYVLSTVTPIGDSAICLLKVETKGGMPSISVISSPPTLEAGISDVKSTSGLSFTLKRTQTIKDKAGKVRKASATRSGAWFGSITPPEPTRMRLVAAARGPMRTSGEAQAKDGEP